jgi:hypothetical protein
MEHRLVDDELEGAYMEDWYTFTGFISHYAEL